MRRGFRCGCACTGGFGLGVGAVAAYRTGNEVPVVVGIGIRGSVVFIVYGYNAVSVRGSAVCLGGFADVVFLFRRLLFNSRNAVFSDVGDRYGLFAILGILFVEI